jgi:hypothetical protein
MRQGNQNYAWEKKGIRQKEELGEINKMEDIR